MSGSSLEPVESVMRRLTVERRDADGWPVHRIAPKTGGPTGGVLYLHGGGYIVGIQPMHWDFVARLADLTGRAVTLPDYPVAPAHTHRDMFPTLRRLYADVAPGTATNRFAVMGDSAGATMSLALVQSLPQKRRPGDLILMSPWLDATMTNPGIGAVQPQDPMNTTEGLIGLARQWAGPDELSTPELSPINGPLEHLGHVAVFAGTHDILAPDARRLTELAAGADGTDLVLREYPGMTHSWMLTGTGPEADAVRSEIADRLGRSPGPAGRKS
jgi:acetyl esterase/lipase